jgi:hypothetical protein
MLASTLAAALLTTVLALAATASAATLNVTGTWQAVYHCASGACANTNVPATLTLTEAAGSATVSGSASGKGLEGSVSGTLSGNVLTLSVSGAHGYAASGSETISADGGSWAGTYKDSNATSGTLTATRGATSAAGGGPRRSGLAVLCSFEAFANNYICTAEASDDSAISPAVTPTGTVKFSASGGSFAPQETCTLAPSLSSPATASCIVVFIPPLSGLPAHGGVPVSASYSGDGVFAPSSAKAGAPPRPKVVSIASAPAGATVTVSCPSGLQSCPINVALSIVQRGTAIRASSKPKSRTVTIAARTVTLQPAHKQKIKVSLNRAGRKLLAAHRRLPAQVKVSSRGVVLKSQKLTIRQKRRA